LQSCSFCFGCIGIKNKSYCIFNRQYTKEERHAKVDELFAQMDKEGTLGDFLPASICPYYFNDTIAYQLNDSFTQQEVAPGGYLRRDQVVTVDIPDGVEVVMTHQLGDYESHQDGQRHIDPAILTKVIKDDQ
jgi:hypothetical protein